MDYSAVGDTTNLASRMEGAAKPGGTLVSKNTQRIVQHYFEFNALDKIEVKGKKEPQEVFELLAPSEVETRFDASVAKGLTRFVGRRNSMAALMEPYEKVQSGSGQVVGVVGEAGVGKTRLIREFRNRLTPGTHTYLQGQCIHYGDSIIYLPILDIIKSYFEIEEGDREFIIRQKIKEKVFGLGEKLEHTIPSFQELLSLKADDEEYSKLEPQEKRERTFEAIRDLLIRESQNNVLILVIEDLHWIDRTSEEFLEYLIEWIANAQVMLVLLYRTEYHHQWGSKTYYSKIGLDQLGTESSVELVKAMLEGGEVVPELKELILNRSAGNPLFMEEFTQALLENGSIEKKDNQYVLRQEVSEIEVPDTIQGIIASRMDRLEDNLKRTMQVASVIGRDFAFRILQTITGLREELKSYLLNLQGLEFIYEKQLFPELEYIFKHALTQEVAYNSLLQNRRKEIHENIGKAIEQLYAERLEEFYEILAYHYSKSDDLERAYRYLKLAGEKATRNHATWEAFRFCKGALNIFNQLPDTEENKIEKLEVLRLLAIPISLLGFPEDSLEILQEGERLSKELGNNRILAKFYSGLGMYYSHKGDHFEAMKYTENGFEEARKIQDIEVMTSLAFELCTSYFGSGDFYKISNVARSVLGLIEKKAIEYESFGRLVSTHPVLYAYCGNSLGQLGEFKEGRTFCEKSLHVVDKNDLRTLGLCELQYGYLLVTKGDGKLAKEHFQKCIEYTEEMKWFFVLALAWTGLGGAYQLLGDPETGRRHIEKALNIQNDAGVEWWLSLHYWYLSQTYFATGNLKNARSSIEEALKLSQKNNEKWIEGLALIWLGRILGAKNQSHIERWEDNILSGINLLKDLKLRPFSSQGHLFLGGLCFDSGQREKALENLKKAETEFKDMGMEYWLDRTREILASLY
jgi:predicted ATPase